MQTTRRHPRFRGWRRVVFVALLAWLAVSCVRAFWLENYHIPSASMQPLLQEGDAIIVDRTAFATHAPNRGDVVVVDGRGSFEPAATRQLEPGELALEAGRFLGLAGQDFAYVKRVVGVAGDRISCCAADGRLRVNGVPVNEPYLFPGDRPSELMFDVQVPEGHVWLMGDHRSDSRDSRDLLGAPGGGMIAEEKVIGRASFRWWPLDKFGQL